MSIDRMNDADDGIFNNPQKLKIEDTLPTFAKAMQAYLLYYPKLSTVDIGKMLGVR